MARDHTGNVIDVVTIYHTDVLNGRRLRSCRIRRQFCSRLYTQLILYAQSPDDYSNGGFRRATQRHNGSVTEAV